MDDIDNPRVLAERLRGTERAFTPQGLAQFAREADAGLHGTTTAKPSWSVAGMLGYSLEEFEAALGAQATDADRVGFELGRRERERLT